MGVGVDLPSTGLQVLCWPRVSNRVTSGLMDGGACVFEVRSWSAILRVQEAGHGGSLCSQREGKIASYMRMSVI